MQIQGGENPFKLAATRPYMQAGPEWAPRGSKPCPSGARGKPCDRGVWRGRIHGEPCAPMQDCCTAGTLRNPVVCGRCPWLGVLEQLEREPRLGEGNTAGSLGTGLSLFGGTAMPGASGGVLGVKEMQPRREWLASRSTL